MGRELKRVPLDFQWPTNKVWQGFLNPHYELSSECPHCENGNSPEGKAWNDKWYGYGGFTPTNPYPANHPGIVQRAMRNFNYDYLWPDGNMEIVEKPKNKQWSPTVFEGPGWSMSMVVANDQCFNGPDAALTKAAPKMPTHDE